MGIPKTRCRKSAGLKKSSDGSFRNPSILFLYYRCLSSGVKGQVFAIEILQLEGLGNLSGSRR
jgi:hypothetical protein